MMSYIVFYLGVTAVIAAGLYMFHDNETSKYSKLQKQIQEVAQRNLEVWKTNKEYKDGFDAAWARLLAVEGKISELSVEVESLQTHCAKLRKSQLSLQEKVSTKRPLIKLPTGAIQVEIFTPSRGLGKKPKQKETVK